MQGTFARLGSWGRKALVLAALIGGPMLAAVPAAEAGVASRAVPAVMPAVLIDQGAPLAATQVQYYGPRRGDYRGRDRFRGPPPGYYRRPYARRYYGPPRRFAGPPPRYYRYR